MTLCRGELSFKFLTSTLTDERNITYNVANFVQRKDKTLGCGEESARIQVSWKICGLITYVRNSMKQSIAPTRSKVYSHEKSYINNIACIYIFIYITCGKANSQERNFLQNVSRTSQRLPPVRDLPNCFSYAIQFVWSECESITFDWRKFFSTHILFYVLQQ